MTHTRTTPYCIERNVFFMTLAVFALCFGLYVYFVSASVVHVIVHKEVDREIATLNSHISELETQYLVAKENITLTDAYARGFTKQSAKVVYVTKRPTGLVRASNDEI